jgi:formylmethanofuran dehydrogenase subunit C
VAAGVILPRPRPSASATAAMPLVVSPRFTSSETFAIDLAGVVPQRVATLSIAEVGDLRILADGRSASLGELFDLSGAANDLTIECRGDFSRVHRIAAGMAGGTMRVLGSVGRHAGEGMTAGLLDVAGDAGDWLACELVGGEVRIAGDASDNVGAALPGRSVGMRGGLVQVAGRVGHLAGARLRRGVVAVGRGCGDAAGFEMRAGTVVVGGPLGAAPGLGMRRGSIVALTAQPTVPTTFRRGRAWHPPFLPLLLRHLAAGGFAPARAVAPPLWRQWHGDFLAGGRGELLHPA